MPKDSIFYAGGAAAFLRVVIPPDPYRIPEYYGSDPGLCTDLWLLDSLPFLEFLDCLGSTLALQVHLAGIAIVTLAIYTVTNTIQDQRRTIEVLRRVLAEEKAANSKDVSVQDVAKRQWKPPA